MSRIASFIGSAIMAAAGYAIVQAGDALGLPVFDAPLVRLGLLVMIGSPLIWLVLALLRFAFTPERPAPVEPMLMRGPLFGTAGGKSVAFAIGIRG
jgi:hypothetical protein